MTDSTAAPARQLSESLAIEAGFGTRDPEAADPRAARHGKTPGLTPHGTAVEAEKCPLCGGPAATRLEWLFLARAPLGAIAQAVAVAHDISVEALLGPCRQKRYAAPRHLAIWLACHLRPDLSLPTIARAFCRDYSTALYARRKLDAEMTTIPQDVWAALQAAAGEGAAR